LKELITFRESRAHWAQMIRPLPIALAGLAEFPGSRAAGLRRVASFGLLWRRLCDLQFGVYGLLRLCDRLPGVCALPQPLWLLRCVCGSLRLSFLRSSAWGSSLPPLRLGKGLNLKLVVYARPASGDKKCKDRTLRGAGGFHMYSACRRRCGLRGRVWVSDFAWLGRLILARGCRNFDLRAGGSRLRP
jgi:hypothetical protein